MKTLLNARTEAELDKLIAANPGSQKLAIVQHPSGKARFMVFNSGWEPAGPEWKSRVEAFEMLHIVSLEANGRGMNVVDLIKESDRNSQGDPEMLTTIPDSEWVKVLNDTITEDTIAAQSQQRLSIQPDGSDSPTPVRINLKH